MKNSRLLSEDDWRELGPKIGNKVARDNRVLKSVDLLLSAPPDELDVMVEVTRMLIAQRDASPCDDSKLGHEIDMASLFICDQAIHNSRVQESRYLNSDL